MTIMNGLLPTNITTSHKVLVTGGAGFLGSHICEKLLLSGKQVVIVDNFNNETSSLLEKKKYIKFLHEISLRTDGAFLKTYNIDILNENRLSEIINKESPTDCIHAAALVMDRKSVNEPMRYITNNVVGTQSLLNAIQKTGTIKRFVFISSRSAVGETLKANDKVSEDVILRPINPYGATKVAAEALCHVFHKNFGLSIAICRLQPLYGPRSRKDMMPSLLIESILTNKEVIKYGNGTAVRDWLYVEDAAAGVLAALKYSDEFSIFNFGTGIGTTLNELIQLVIDVTGGKPNIVFKDILPGDAVLAGTCDFQKANDVLGWRPTTDLKTGLRLMYEYMKINQPHSSK